MICSNTRVALRLRIFASSACSLPSWSSEDLEGWKAFCHRILPIADRSLSAISVAKTVLTSNCLNRLISSPLANIVERRSWYRSSISKSQAMVMERFSATLLLLNSDANGSPSWTSCALGTPWWSTSRRPTPTKRSTSSPAREDRSDRLVYAALPYLSYLPNIILPLCLPSYYCLSVNRLSTITNDHTPNIENTHA